MPKVKIHISQSDNDSYFGQKLPTWRNGFCVIERKLYPAQDAHGVYEEGQYGAIKIGIQFAFVHGIGDTWDIEKLAPVGWIPATGSADDAFDARVEALPRLQQQAGAAYTLYLLASKALHKTAGDPCYVDWDQVHKDVFAKAVGQDQQPADKVLEVIKLHSPGAVTPEQIAAVEAMGDPGKMRDTEIEPTVKPPFFIATRVLGPGEPPNWIETKAVTLDGAKRLAAKLPRGTTAVVAVAVVNAKGEHETIATLEDTSAITRSRPVWRDHLVVKPVSTRESGPSGP